MDRQRGAVGALLTVIFVLVMVGLLATYALSRLNSARSDAGAVMQSLAAASDALDQFAASSQRLPCPANPAVDDGVEVQATATTCSFPEGTVPWRTIGLRRDYAFDPWGRKISYRVYTGSAGSFTQPGGVSMVECDTIEPSIGKTAPSGLCVTSTDPYARSTSAEKFLAGKGLSLTDGGVAVNAAYVLISHGATGLGGYTASGARLALPAGDERKNTQATGDFTIRPFSDAETAATAGTHFDDYLAYRSVTDLVQRIGLQARNWPDLTTTSLLFDAATVAAAQPSATVAPGATLANSIDFGSATITAFTGDTSNPTPGVTYDANSYGSGLGVAGGGSTMMSSADNEYLQVKLKEKATKFAITLNDFGVYAIFTVPFTEHAELRFYDGTSSIVTKQLSGCRADGNLASFAVDVGTPFDTVEIRPTRSTSSWFDYISRFLVSEITACTPTTAVCKTSLSSGGNNCP
ncbi:MAG TPA: hypothetical protein VFK48_03010 [Usitatibacter sp.]|nr:hypothetical protein [Usitatibacter sp.]